MKCSTGKNAYESEEMATEALIQNYVIHNHRSGSGPINIYQCNDCNLWHFTSKGETAEFLKDQKVRQRIKKEQRAHDWERDLR